MDGTALAGDGNPAPAPKTRTSYRSLIVASRPRICSDMSMRVAVSQGPERRGGGRCFDQGLPLRAHGFGRWRIAKVGGLAADLDRTEGAARRRDHGFRGLKIRGRGIGH